MPRFPKEVASQWHTPHVAPSATPGFSSTLKQELDLDEDRELLAIPAAPTSTDP
jgi:hypothetical protein